MEESHPYLAAIGLHRRPLFTYRAQKEELSGNLKPGKSLIGRIIGDTIWMEGERRRAFRRKAQSLGYEGTSIRPFSVELYYESGMRAGYLSPDSAPAEVFARAKAFQDGTIDSLFRMTIKQVPKAKWYQNRKTKEPGFPSPEDKADFRPANKTEARTISSVDAEERAYLPGFGVRLNDEISDLSDEIINLPGTYEIDPQELAIAKRYGTLTVAEEYKLVNGEYIAVPILGEESDRHGWFRYVENQSQWVYENPWRRASDTGLTVQNPIGKKFDSIFVRTPEDLISTIGALSTRHQEKLTRTALDLGIMPEAFFMFEEQETGGFIARPRSVQFRVRNAARKSIQEMAASGFAKHLTGKLTARNALIGGGAALGLGFLATYLSGSSEPKLDVKERERRAHERMQEVINSGRVGAPALPDPWLVHRAWDNRQGHHLSGSAKRNLFERE